MVTNHALGCSTLDLWGSPRDAGNSHRCSRDVLPTHWIAWPATPCILPRLGSEVDINIAELFLSFSTSTPPLHRRERQIQSEPTCLITSRGCTPMTVSSIPKSPVKGKRLTRAGRQWSSEPQRLSSGTSQDTSSRPLRFPSGSSILSTRGPWDIAGGHSAH